MGAPQPPSHSPRHRPRGQSWGHWGRGSWGPGGAEVPLGGPTSPPPPPPRPAPGQVKRGPGFAPGGGAATGVGKGNNSTFIWDCLALSGWAEDEAANRAAGEGVVSGIWLHTCSCLTLCVLGPSARRGRAAPRRGTGPRPRSARGPAWPASWVPGRAQRSRRAREWGSLGTVGMSRALGCAPRPAPASRAQSVAPECASGAPAQLGREGKREVAPGPRRGFPAALGPFREAGLPEAARRPRPCQGRGARGAGQAQRAAAGRGNERWARPPALNASRRGAAGEPGRPAHPTRLPASPTLPGGRAPGGRAPRCTCPRRDPARPRYHPLPPGAGALARRTIGACLWAEEPRRVRRPRASPLIP